MFAVIKTGGRQYRVVPDDVLEIGKIAGDVGTIVQLGEVLLVGGEFAGAGRSHGGRCFGCRRSAAAQAWPEGHLVPRSAAARIRPPQAWLSRRIMAPRITEILTNDNKPTIGPRPKREKPVVSAPVDGDDEAPKPAKEKAAPKKAVAKKKAAASKPRAKPDAKKASAKGQTSGQKSEA